MDQSEAVVAKWLRAEGHKVHPLGPDDPPDFVVNSDIAVEVTTLSTEAHRSIVQFFAKLFRDLGNAENGRGYAVAIEYEDEKMFEATDKGKKKAELKRCTRQKLKAHYRDPKSGTRPDGRCLVSLLHGITLEIWPWQRLSKHPVEYKYTVYMFMPSKGDIGIPALIQNIQAAIDKKSSKRSIRERAAQYREWWLVVTGFHSLYPEDLKILSDELVLGAPWKHLLGVNSPTQGVVLKSREDGGSEGS